MAGTKGLIVIGFWGIALMLFALIGFNLVESVEFDLVALGLASLTAGFIVNTFMN